MNVLPKKINMTQHIEKSGMGMSIKTVGLKVFCFLCLTLAAAPALSQALYPWEQDDAEGNKQTIPQARKPIETGSPSGVENLSNTLQLGPFQIRTSDSWMAIPLSLEEDVGGKGIINLRTDGTTVAIIEQTDDPLSYSNDKHRIKYEKTLMNDIAQNSPDAISYMKIMGNKTVIIRSFIEDEGTFFYVLPYDGTSCYALFVIYEQRVNKLSSEEKAILSTLEIAD
jgi:hypothetical protein